MNSHFWHFKRVWQGACFVNNVQFFILSVSSEVIKTPRTTVSYFLISYFITSLIWCSTEGLAVKTCILDDRKVSKLIANVRYYMLCAALNERKYMIKRYLLDITFWNMFAYSLRSYTSSYRTITTLTIRWHCLKLFEHLLFTKLLLQDLRALSRFS